MLRVHSAVFRELGRQLLAEHGFGIDSYGVMITLVGAPARRVPIGELGLRRNLSPSGISRSVDRLTKRGLVERANNPDRRDLKRLGELWEKAMPGAVSSPTWPL
jgi:DNA-binding MarR family transcriptional regulator